MNVRDWTRKGLLSAGAVVGTTVCLSFLSARGLAFQEGENATPPGQAKAGEQEVVIKREALKLTDPKLYRAPLHLQAARTVVLTAAADGIVRTVGVKPGQKINQQSEAVRLDDQRATLLVKRAKALLQAARHEKQIAQTRGESEATALAEARLEAAQAEVELAQLELDQAVVRAPFSGEVERVFVVEGQFVRAGERLAIVADASKLLVEIPVERPAAAPGGTIDLRVEDSTVKAKVESVGTLSPAFESLRELTISPASAVVSVDNAGGKFASGQTVYCDLIPLLPVTLVPTVAVNNVADGTRRVQVLRENVVRDLTVRILGKVGTDSVFVSGRFSEGDEVIVSSTRALADGTPLRAILAAAGRGPAATPREGGPATPGAKGKPPIGF